LDHEILVSDSNLVLSTILCILSGSDPHTGIATLGTSKGLLELYHIPADASTPYTSGNDYSAPGIGFGHVGFTVPDVAAASDRIKSFGYEIIKPLDEAKEEQMGLPNAVVQGKHGAIDGGYKHVFKQLVFVKDPDVSGLQKREDYHMLTSIVGLLDRTCASSNKRTQRFIERMRLLKHIIKQSSIFKIHFRLLSPSMTPASTHIQVTTFQ
jgi:catechol 2,3-dioxygenase-like lactoylglutathione lyase family enzyme